MNGAKNICSKYNTEQKQLRINKGNWYPGFDARQVSSHIHTYKYKWHRFQSEDSGEHSCGVCRKGVASNSIRCVECLTWVHKRCSCISGQLKSNVDFHCRRCFEGEKEWSFSVSFAERGCDWAQCEVGMCSQVFLFGRHTWCRRRCGLWMRGQELEWDVLGLSSRSFLLSWQLGWQAVLYLWGVTPSGASQPPKFSLTPTGLVKKHQKYIADPPLVLPPQIEYCWQGCHACVVRAGFTGRLKKGALKMTWNCLGYSCLNGQKCVSRATSYMGFSMENTYLLKINGDDDNHT